MAKIALVTESTAYIPQDIVSKYAITVIPQVLIWGTETYRDGVDIKPVEFYERLSKAKVMPSSSQATPIAFEEAYNHLLEQEYEILTIVISSKLSGTMDSAIQAKNKMPGKPIEIVDSYTTAMALGFIVLETARLAEKGASLKECKSFAERIKSNTGVLFAVDTLEFLHRGGRIGGAKRFLGTVLNSKPILELRDGRVEPLERVRTRKKSLLRLVDILEERVAGRTPVRLATLHANSPDDARDILEEAEKRLKPVETVFSEVSPVVGTHAGPGTVGLAFMVGV